MRRRPSRNRMLTETHSTQSSENGEQYDPADAAVKCQTEYWKTEDQNECGLAAHNHELSGDVREQNLDACDAAHQTSLEHALVSLD